MTVLLLVNALSTVKILEVFEATKIGEKPPT